jgi:hypothetical protein
MLLLAVATMATALFAGAALYVSAVEHPARWSRLHAVRTAVSVVVLVMLLLRFSGLGVG